MHEPTLGDNARIGRFIVLERVAAGGMGVVYAAYDPHLDRKVAIKVIRGWSTSETTRARIVREARAMARLSHPNVAQVFEVGEVLGGTFIAMEFVHGVTLRAWLAQPRRWRDVLAVYLQAGRGLAAAHAEGLVHRDFKPDNAMIGRDGRVRVLDFGLVRTDASADPDDVLDDRSGHDLHDPLATPLTRTGTLLGTPNYMAAEQFLGRPVDARTDQFALCVSLWEGLGGARPFAGESSAELMANVSAGRIAGVPRDDRMPAWIRSVLLRGLAADPAARYPAMDALLAALESDPSRRRRRLAGAAVGLAAVGLVVGGLSLDRARRVQACEVEAAAVADVWNDDARRRVEAGLLATGKAYAPGVWSRVEPRLDALAAGWSAARRQSCLATAVDRTRVLALQDRTVECLDERRDELAALVDTLAAADDATLRGAVELALDVELAECLDDRWLAQRVAPPDDPATRAQVVALRRRLTDADAMKSGGNVPAALTVATDVLAQARALGWAPLLAEAQHSVGIFSDRTGDFATGEAMLQGAYWTALRAGADDTAVRAGLGATFTVGVSLARNDAGLDWARHTAALLGRIGREDSMWSAELESYLGDIHSQRDDFATAIDHHRRSIALVEAIQGPDHVALAIPLNKLGIACAERGDLDAAQPHFERALAIQEAALGSDHPDLAFTLASLGSLYRLRGDLPRAQANVERTIALEEIANGPRSPHLIVYRTNLGNLLAQRGAHDDAAVQLQRAVDGAADVHGEASPDYAAVLHELGRLNFTRGHLEEATAQYTRALEIRERSLGPEHTDVAQNLHSLGVLANTREAYADAVALFTRVRAIRERKLGPDSPGVGAALLGLGVAHAGLRADDEALAEIQQALAAVERRVGRDHLDTTPALRSLGELHSRRGEHTEALAVLRRALAVQEEARGPEHVDVAGYRARLGAAKLRSGDLDGAEADLVRAAASLEGTFGPDYPPLGEVWTDLGELMLARGRHADAAALLIRALPLRERLAPGADGLAATRFALARASWPTPGERARARGLAEQARDAWRAAGPAFVDEQRSVDVWLAQHRR